MAQPLWIADLDALERLVDRVAKAPAFAIDTEFHREKTYFPHLALVQIASPEEVAVVDPLAVDPAPLRRLLEGESLAVLHAAEQDLEVLRLACGAEPRRMFDTQVAAAFLGMGFASLARLVEKVVGRSLPKGDRLTDWTRRPLDEGQVAYAASDVEHLLAIESALRERAAEAGVLDWVEEECERLRCKPSGPGEPETAWWRIKGSRSLRGKTRGVAQEVAAWRERVAQARDIPPRFVLSDLALAGIVHRPPATVEQRREVRGIDGRAVRDGTAAAIVAAAQAGAALAPDRLRLPPAGESVDEGRGSRTALALALVAQIADERGIEPTLLATRTDVQLLASGRASGRLASGWRGELVGSALRRLLDGELAITGSKDGGARLVELDSAR